MVEEQSKCDRIGTYWAEEGDKGALTGDSDVMEVDDFFSRKLAIDDCQPLRHGLTGANLT